MSSSSAPAPALAPFAVRMRQQEERRAQVMRQRQMERDQKRALRQARSSSSSGAPPASVVVPEVVVAPSRLKNSGSSSSSSTCSSSESPPPPPTPPLPAHRSVRNERFFENADAGVKVSVERRPRRKVEEPPPSEDPDEMFRSMLRNQSSREVKKKASSTRQRRPIRPPPRRAPAADPPKPHQQPETHEQPLAPPRVNEARRRAALEEEERRQREPLATTRKPVVPPRRQKPLRPRNKNVVAAKQQQQRPAPLCVRRDAEQRKRNAAEAAEPNTRRCLDKRTARLRYARHFAGALAAYRERPPPPLAQEELAARVVVRVRPLLAHEASRGEFAAVSCASDCSSSDDASSRWITVHECTMHADMIRLMHAARRFPCSATLAASVDEDRVFEVAALPALGAARAGKPAALFMFGQTGSGKTHSMTSIERRVADVLFAVDERRRSGCRVSSVRYFEIRGKKAFDLLGEGEATEIRVVDEPGACRTDGATVCSPRSTSEFLETLARGRKKRATAATDVNGGSSRSHAVCRLEVTGGGSLTLVDCAGSERSHDSMYHDAQRRKESAEINQSIYALKECIRQHNAALRWAASSNKANKAKPAPPPFRNSALTRVLRQALESDDAHLCVVATVSPAATDAEHSIATLRTVCQLAGYSSKLLEMCSDSPSEVPKLAAVVDDVAAQQRRGESTKSASSLASRQTTTSGSNPPLPKTWSSAQLSAFLARIDPKASSRVVQTDLDGNNVLRMSVLAVAAALTEADSNRATKIIYALRDETARIERIRYQARIARRREAQK